jgi:hypothetical protein
LVISESNTTKVIELRSAEAVSSRASELAKARTFAEAARRASAPWDRLPGDDRALRILLWQRAAHFALLSCVSEPGDCSSVEALHRAPRAWVERAAGGSGWLSSIERALVLDAGAAASPGDDADGQIHLLAYFTERLLAQLERRPRAAQTKRLAKVVALAVTLLLAATAFGALRRWLSPDLARTSPYTTSSSIFDCKQGECGDAFFHTQEEDSPWIEYDLGRARVVRRVELKNRWDCCYERAVPLLVETSIDHKGWTVAARTEQAFLVWSADFAQRARYLRLRVDGRSSLHLQSVSIF